MTEKINVEIDLNDIPSSMITTFIDMWSPGFCDRRMAEETIRKVLRAAPAREATASAWDVFRSDDGRYVCTVHSRELADRYSNNSYSVRPLSYID